MKHIRTKKDFEAELSAGGDRFVYFYSGWCHYCSDFLNSLEKHHKSGHAGFLKLCVDELPALEEHFQVEVVPSVLFFSGGKLVKRLDGVLGRGLNEEKLLAFMKACEARPAGGAK
ncbi:MAG: thioredoxin family protein [Elusimicrobia bacterium]|nr:thioredoxin family protein [Elusimicrobiota bacterium]